MKLRFSALLIIGFLLSVGCGGKEEQKPAASAPESVSATAQEEEVATAAGLLEQGQLESDSGQLNNAVQTLKQLVEQFPDSDEAKKAQDLINGLEAKLARTQTATEKIQSEQTEDFFAPLVKVSEDGYDSYYDSAVYEMKGSKVYLTFRWSGSGQANIRFIIELYYGADLPSLSIKRFTMNVGDQPYLIVPRSDQLSVEKQGNLVKETMDTRPTMAHRGMIEAIVAANKVVLVAEGAERNEEHELTDVEKKGLNNVMTAFISIGGIW